MYVNEMYCEIKRSMNLGYVCYLEINTEWNTEATVDD